MTFLIPAIGQASLSSWIYR